MKRFTRLAALILCVVIMLCAVSCGKDKSAVVMSLDGTEITENVYKYWVCSYKATFLSTFSDMKDTDEFWDSILYDDVTAEKYLSDLVKEYVKNGLITSYLFDKEGLKLTSEDRETAENIVADLCDYTGGGKNAFNAILAEYGVNYDMLVNIYLDEYKSTYLYNYVFENGILAIDDEAKQEYLESNYSRVRHIYINNVYDSEKSYYDDDGNFVMEPLDAETQKIQDDKISAVKKAIAEGQDFDTIYEQYSEEKEYKNGYYLCVETQGLPEELITNAMSTGVDEVKEFDSDYGYHAIKGMEMDKGAWSDEANEDFFDGFTDNVYGDVFVKYLETYYDKITVDEEAIGKISLRDALPNYSFQY